MSITKEQREAMAADLFERAAKMIREGVTDINPIRIVGGVALSLAIGPGFRDDSEYVRALGFVLRGDRDGINAARAAILNDEPPPDSLAGKVAKMRREALSELRQRVKGGGGPRADQAQGHVEGIDDVLELLGVKP